MADIAVATPDVSAPPSGATQSEPTSDFRSFRETENAKAVALKSGKPEQGKPAAPAALQPEKPSADGEKPKENTAPASEAGKPSQESKRPNAETRIRELISERKALEDRIAKLEGKSDVKPESSPAPKAEPSKSLEPPTKPKLADFKGENAYQEFEDAKDKYYEDLADYKSSRALADYRAELQQEKQKGELLSAVDEARTRYGADAGESIDHAAAALSSDDIPAAVRLAINGSDVMVDLLYVAGKDPTEVEAFVKLAKSNPMAAIKKVAVMEHLIREELAKGGKSRQAAEATTERGEDGKFVSTKPEKPATKAPPIGTEVSGRGSAPPDAVTQAVKTGDFRAFRDIENQKALDRHRGR